MEINEKLNGERWLEKRGAKREREREREGKERRAERENGKKRKEQDKKERRDGKRTCFKLVAAETGICVAVPSGKDTSSLREKKRERERDGGL